MDIVDLIRSTTAADIVLLLFCAAAFVFGFFQGATRGLMVLGAWAFAFILAANAWSPLGQWLSRYWTQFVPEYSQMLAFGIAFVVALVLANIAIAIFTKRVPLLSRAPIADEVLGGFLGLAIALLLVAGLLVGLDTFYGTRQLEGVADVSWVTGLHQALSGSVVGGWIEDTIVPSVVTLFSPVIPAEIGHLILG